MAQVSTFDGDAEYERRVGLLAWAQTSLRSRVERRDEIKVLGEVRHQNEVYHELTPRVVVRARPITKEVVLGLHEGQEGGGEVMTLED